MRDGQTSRWGNVPYKNLGLVSLIRAASPACRCCDIGTLQITGSYYWSYNRLDRLLVVYGFTGLTQVTESTQEKNKITRKMRIAE